MKLQRTFVGAKLNKDVDERLLQSGELRHAVNVRVSNTDNGQSLGTATNVKGNKKLTNLNLINGICIGAYADSFNNLIYWAVTADNKDTILEYDFKNKVLSIVLESNKGGVLNFNKNYLITHFHKVINGDRSKDLLLWTDGYNPPRCANIARSKTYGLNGFTEGDISMIKEPPRFAPIVQQTYTSSLLENYLEDQFLSFCYRYKYLDGQYSALSSFTSYQFSPSAFDIDYQTMENKGMINKYNAVNIIFNTGDRRVTDIELVYKASNSNALYLIETFNKKKNLWSDNSLQSFKFSNSKKYTVLPEKELYRSYDNVPLKASAQAMIGNIISYGDYTEGYNMVDNIGEDVKLSMDLSVISKEQSGLYLPSIPSNNLFTIDLSSVSLNVGNKLSFTIYLKETTYNRGTFNNSFEFVFNKSYKTVSELVSDSDFVFFVENIMTEGFKQDYQLYTPVNPSGIKSISNFTISGSSDISKTITIKSPIVVVEERNVEPPVEVPTNWSFQANSSLFYNTTNNSASVKTNRSYEVVVIYKDAQGRASTAITSPNNTIYVPQNLSDRQNRLQAVISSKPPYWADRYQFAVKQNKREYQNLFTNIFYQDGLYRWVKLEGTNKDKVKEGDILIVKSDLGGVRRDVVKTVVLEVSQKDKDFLPDNVDPAGNKIIEEAGLYMKIKPAGFDMSWRPSTVRSFEASSHLRYPVRAWTQPLFGIKDETTFKPYELKGGSTVRIYISFRAYGDISYEAIYDKSFRVQGTYAGIKEWFMAEVQNLGSFGKQWTWDGVSDIGGNIGNEGRGQADEWRMNSGWGFASDGSSFFVVPHRKGTASRNIQTEVKFEVMYSDGTVIFETEAKDTDTDIYFTTESDLPIINGNHTGNVRDQSGSAIPAIIELDFFNCYSQGNGVESYQYKDSFNSNFLNIDLRPTSVAVEGFKEVRRYADITYSTGAYVENNGINGLNEFNLSEANYKEDIDKSYGYIKKLFTRDTDLLCLQENKIHRILYRKDLLMGADGSGTITGTKEILGQAIPIQGNYGITRPESFVFDGYTAKWVDDRNGLVLRLLGDELKEISTLGMSQFFRDSLKATEEGKKVAGYDFKYREYVVSVGDIPIRPTENVNCSDIVEKSNFTGAWDFYVDSQYKRGNTGFNVESNGVPIRFIIKVDGVTIDKGFYGDSSYNQQLIDMGYPPVVGNTPADISFFKNGVIESGYELNVFTPFEGATMKITFRCIFNGTVAVTTIIKSDTGNVGKVLEIDYSWSAEDRNGQVLTESNTLNTGVSLFKKHEGERGTLFYPELNSKQILKVIENSSNKGTFKGGIMKYYISNTELFESDINIISSNGIIVPYATQDIPSGGTIYTGITSEILTSRYVYVLFEVQQGIKTTDDYVDCQQGSYVEASVIDNDEVTAPYTIEIVTPPTSGTAAPNSSTGKIIYTNDGSISTNDSFTYRILKDGRYSNISTVYVTILFPSIRAVDDVFNVDYGATVFLDVLANDDLGNYPTDILIKTPPMSGIAQSTGGYYPKISYTAPIEVVPDNTDTLTYYFTQYVSTSNDAKVTINLTNPPITP